MCLAYKMTSVLRKAITLSSLCLLKFHSSSCFAGLCSDAGLIFIFPLVNKRMTFALKCEINCISISLSSCVFTAKRNRSKYTHGKTLPFIALRLEVIWSAYVVVFYHVQNNMTLGFWLAFLDHAVCFSLEMLLFCIKWPKCTKFSDFYI